MMVDTKAWLNLQGRCKQQDSQQDALPGRPAAMPGREHTTPYGIKSAGYVEDIHDGDCPPQEVCPTSGA
ncbi:MAG TPA: hypothetical protein QF800_01985 [Phycisphaerales bacterium]|nr:hypothetical protein [Phycisphaerales bacterium]